MSKINLVDAGDFSGVEICLPQKECHIINDELVKEVMYWKNIALENVDSSFHNGYTATSPKRRKVVPKLKKVNFWKCKMDEILQNLKQCYNIESLDDNHYIPSEMSVSKRCEIEPHLKTHSLHIQKIENYYLRNAYLYGKWLDKARKLFRYEKYVLKNEELPTTFEKWLKGFDISRQTADNYRRLGKLIDKAPKLLNCHVTVKYLLTYIKDLTGYFTEVNGIWSHKHDCKCVKCLDYFTKL